jgi:cytochrome c oxidase subunit II
VTRRFVLIALATAGLVILVGVGFLTWLGTSRGLVPLKPDSPNASDEQHIYVFVGAFASFIFLVVTVPLAAFIVRFRSAGRPRTEDGPQIRGNTRIEITWTVVPVLILVAIATFTFVLLPQIKNAPAASNALDVKVVGRQFYWEYHYPNGVVSIDLLRAPADRVVDLTILAPPWDVIHSWWVPELGGKRDAIPGIVNSTWFRARRTGTFDGRCAEFCGVLHAYMRTTVQVMPDAEFDRWLAQESASQRRPRSTTLGRETFAGVCAKCHGPQGQGGYARAINNNPLFNDPAATQKLLTNGLQNGTRVMPAVGRGWSVDQMSSVIRYLHQNLAPKGAGGGTATGGG